MIETFHSIILGAVQGITEFLPISSSGHLVLVPWLFNWNYEGLAFDVALHLGTVLAIVVFFWKDWTNIIAGAIGKEMGVGSQEQKDINALRPTPYAKPSYPSNLLWQIIIASIPAAILGYLIEDYVESKLHSPLLLALNLAIFGVILFLVDKYAKTKLEIKNTRYKQSFIVGIAQSLALIPGVSRSGITMLAGRALGLNRESSARFSFLLGTPAMLGAFVFAAKDLAVSDLNSAFILGVISSTVFGLLAIKYLLEYLKKGSFALFMWYRIVLAIIVMSIYLIR